MKKQTTRKPHPLSKAAMMQDAPQEERKVRKDGRRKPMSAETKAKLSRLAKARWANIGRPEEPLAVQMEREAREKETVVMTPEKLLRDLLGLQHAANEQVHWCPRCGLDIDAQRAAMTFKREPFKRDAQA